MLRNKKILLGVTGSIAAYKAAILVRLLVKEGAEIKVIMTESATSFISPLTLSTLSKNPVLVDFVENENGLWNNHVDLGLWADLMLIAPASANSLAKCANGICDNLLVAAYLSARCPVVFAPAMDLDMYAHGSTQMNIGKLKSYGNFILDAEEGELASGLEGKGRMAEPEHIIERLALLLNQNKRFVGKEVLITAGPTQEAIDPVRYISNHSSGKMGFALAKAFRDEGAEVHLISGPVNIEKPHGVQVIDVKSAEEMYQAAFSLFEGIDIAVYVAAVADYAPSTVADKKLKKSEKEMQIELKKTVDIAQNLGKLKRNDQVAIGFALETDNAEENAKLKIGKKNLDMIILNSLGDKGAGFKHDTNKITIVKKSGEMVRFALKSKDEVAKDILDSIANLEIERS